MTEEAKQAARERSKAYYWSLTEDQRKDRAARRSSYMKEYIEKNRQKIKLHKDKWRRRNPEKMEACRSAWEKKNPEQNKLAKKEWAKKNKSLLRAMIADWSHRNPHKLCEYQRRRRAKIVSASIDETAVIFYAYIRSKETVPCYWCGVLISGKEAHIDHVIAISRGGNHCSSNLCASCSKCNLSKSNKFPSEWITSGQMLFDF